MATVSLYLILNFILGLKAFLINFFIHTILFNSIAGVVLIVTRNVNIYLYFYVGAVVYGIGTVSGLFFRMVWKINQTTRRYLIDKERSKSAARKLLLIAGFNVALSYLIIVPVHIALAFGYYLIYFYPVLQLASSIFPLGFQIILNRSGKKRLPRDTPTASKKKDGSNSDPEASPATGPDASSSPQPQFVADPILTQEEKKDLKLSQMFTKGHGSESEPSTSGSSDIESARTSQRSSTRSSRVESPSSTSSLS